MTGRDRSELEKDLVRIKDDLLALRDEVRVKLNLAAKDAKDAFERLEPRVRELAEHVDALGDRAEHEAEKLGARLKDELVDLRARLRRAIDGEH